MTDATNNTAYYTCPLCEATCGLELLVQDDRVVRVRGDRADVFSGGHLCPKGASLGALHSDPDRLRQPLLRRTKGAPFHKVGWDEAFEFVSQRLGELIATHGRESLAMYIGNPAAHSLGATFYNSVLIRALGTSNVYTASSLDQLPQQLAAGLMFGNGLSIPVPDIDRTDHLLVIGANPVVSNGSMWVAPDIKRRLTALIARGGSLVVVDPRRTPTAQIATDHVRIRPGTDAQLLFAMVRMIFERDAVDLGHVAEHVLNIDRVCELAAPFHASRVESICRLEPGTVARLVSQLTSASSAAVYGRIGSSTQEFGTLTSWLIVLLNILTGNLDRVGGVMFPTPLAGAPNSRGTPGHGSGIRVDRGASRVRGLPRVMGELPVAALAEEITTEGPGQIKGLITFAGNPARSTPNSAHVLRALAAVPFMLSVDIYLNETTRFADVVLPAPSALSQSHYDVLLYGLAVRNVANYSPPVFRQTDGQLSEWEILAKLALIAEGNAAGSADPAVMDERVIRGYIEREIVRDTSPIHGRDPDEIMGLLAHRRGPDRILEFLLRTGPYGDGFGAKPDGISLDALERSPHGVDLGPLDPRIPEVLRTPTGMIDLAPDEVVHDVGRLTERLDGSNDRDGAALIMIGRRDLRSNNSWMHNLPSLASGKERCVLLIHPRDADTRGLSTGDTARVSSSRGVVDVLVEVTSDIMETVVCLPHGWGHDDSSTELSVARLRPGVNSNALADEQVVDVPSGTAVLNGIAVTVVRSSDKETAAAADLQQRQLQPQEAI